MSHVFISYSTLNSKFAQQLADKLRKEGFNVWIDNSQLRSSDNWWKSIVLAIRESSAFIVIMTPDAKESKWVQREVTLADVWNKPIFPILLGGDNWEIFVLTQYEDVHKPGGMQPDYKGKLPPENFYEKLAEITPRREMLGTDVTSQALSERPIQDLSVAKEIANPPPKDKIPDKSRVEPPVNWLSAAVILVVIIILGLLLYQTLVLINLIQRPGNIDDYSIVDQREILGDVFPEMTQPVDNSQGTVDVSRDIAANRQFRHIIDVRLNAGSGLDRNDVEESILDTYNIAGRIGEQLCLIPADVPAGKSYAYNLEWTQILREGNIESGSFAGQGDILGTYSIIIDLQCQVIGVQVLN